MPVHFRTGGCTGVYTPHVQPRLWRSTPAYAVLRCRAVPSGPRQLHAVFLIYLAPLPSPEVERRWQWPSLSAFLRRRSAGRCLLSVWQPSTVVSSASSLSVVLFGVSAHDAMPVSTVQTRSNAINPQRWKKGWSQDDTGQQVTWAGWSHAAYARTAAWNCTLSPRVFSSWSCWRCLHPWEVFLDLSNSRVVRVSPPVPKLHTPQKGVKSGSARAPGHGRSCSWVWLSRGVRCGIKGCERWCEVTPRLRNNPRKHRAVKTHEAREVRGEASGPSRATLVKSKRDGQKECMITPVTEKREWTLQ